MKNVPDKIYLLVHGVDKDELTDNDINFDYREHVETLGDHGICWSDARNNDTDEEYIHISEYNKLEKENEHLKYMADDDDFPL